MTERDPSDVIDHGCGKVRVLSQRCDTCVFWPGNRMGLAPGRFEQIVDGNVAAGALLTCHATLPYGPYPDFGPAVCAGFWAKHRHETGAGRIAERSIGIVRVVPPTDQASKEA
jgi:hypothetical protein